MDTKKSSQGNSIKCCDNTFRDIIIIAVCALIVLSGIGWGIYHFRKHSGNAVADDTLIRRYITPVNINIDGSVKSVNFVPNQTVKSGDTLLILDNVKLQTKVVEEESELIDMVNRLSLLKSTVVTSTDSAIFQQQPNDLARSKAGFRNNKISTNANIDNPLGDDNSDQILIAHRIEALDMRKTGINYTVIVAPCDGFADRCNIKEGQLVKAGHLVTNIVSDY